METINLAPTWKFATDLYLAIVIQEAEAGRNYSDAMKNAKDGIYEMAGHLDRMNAESKKRREKAAKKNADLQRGRENSKNY